MKEIKSHPWFLMNLSEELTKGVQDIYNIKENPTSSLQSTEEIMNIINEAKTLPATSNSDQLEDLTEALKNM